MKIYSPRKSKPRAFPRGKSRTAGFFISAAFLGVVGLGAAASFSILRDLPSPERITERAVVESTKIYDRTQKVILYEVHGEEKRTVIPLEEIPDRVRSATLAAEDINFYKHSGLDFRGILRAAFINIIRGDIRQGGSTITQQVAKNSLLGWSQRNFWRKVKEQIMALLIERKYSKDEILEIYLNQIPYGSNAYGIAAASRTFFAKDPTDLTLAESAALASLPKAPTYYSPLGSHQKELLERKDWVLERMHEARLISGEEFERAKKEKLVFAKPSQILAPHFVMYVREYLEEKYGNGFIERSGLKVVTTLDLRLQEAAERAVAEGAEQNQKLVGAHNAALAAIDPKTGEILALVGSKNFFGEPEPKGCNPGVNCKFDPHVNVALRPRQPGSAFKPFVYAAAFKKGYTPETVLMDVPTEFNPLCAPDGNPLPNIDVSKYPDFKCYHPQNYDDKFRGPASLRQSLAQSLNLPSVKLLYLAGVQDSIKTAESLGITTLTNPENYGLSLVLGGAEVTLLEMTSAFGVFSQEGILHPQTPILRVENSKGEVLEEKRETSLATLDTEVARTINDILSDNDARVPVFSPQSSLYFPGRPVAAKTGTTQDFRDAWVIGYTPSIAAGVWVGNNDNTEMNQKGLSIMVAGPIWHKFLEEALGSSPPEYFTKPAERQSEKPLLRGQYRSGSVVKIDKISKKLAAEWTPPELIEEMTFGEVKSILALLKREDPSGPPPEDPNSDPQFKNWQAGIENWLSSNPLADITPPKDLDDLHRPEKKPKIILGETANLGKFPAAAGLEIKVRVDSHFPLNEVLLFMDGALEGTRSAPILSPEIIFRVVSGVKPGEHVIKITAYDAVGNRETVERVVTSY